MRLLIVMSIILNMVMYRVNLRIPLTLLLLGSAAACFDPNAQSSAIVRTVEAAGAGNLTSMTEPEIADWLVRHNDRTLIAHLHQQCQPLRLRADAGWTYRTAEGRVCQAVSFLDLPSQYSADHSQFGNVPGVK